MIEIRRSAERGHFDHGWLEAFHTFSFGDYFDPDFMGFSHLRVINQDRVKPGKGFPTHGHRDMEIVTYVLEGALEHRDSMGNGSQLRPGEVQLMSAGSGVTHSEFNPSSTEPLHLLQMWVHPERRATEPRYEQRPFTTAERHGAPRLVVSPDGSDGSLTIGQDARLFAALLDPGEEMQQVLPSGRVAWLHLATGALEIDGEPLRAGDGVAVTDTGGFTLRGVAPSDLVIWELPA